MNILPQNTSIRILSACIALALNSNAWATEINNSEPSPSSVCPSDVSALTKEQKAKLPVSCLKSESSFLDEYWAVIPAGIAAVAAAVGLSVDNDSDHNNHDGGDNGDDNGDDNGGDNGGDNGDDNGGDNGDDNGGEQIRQFDNGVFWDGKAQTLTVNGVVWNTSKNSDGTYTITNDSGETVQVKKWSINDTHNTISLGGLSADGQTAWVYDNNGKVHITDIANWHDIDNGTADISGGTANGEGNAATLVDGDGNTINTTGDTRRRTAVPERRLMVTAIQ